MIYISYFDFILMNKYIKIETDYISIFLNLLEYKFIFEI